MKETRQEDSQAEREEIQALTSTLNSLLIYRQAAHHNLTIPRRKAFQKLSENHINLLRPYYEDHLNAIDAAIEINADVLAHIASIGSNEFMAPQERSEWKQANAFQVDQTRSSLKQIFRDWSADAASEREICYGRVLSELNCRYPSEQRSQTKVLIPGAGLGRLAFEIARAGFISQGNEFSYHMLILSNFILNHTTGPNEFTIYPFIHTFSSTAQQGNQIRPIRFPDICPSQEMAVMSGDFSYSQGSFTEVYGRDGNAPSASFEKWNVVATVFFIDTAHNVLDYLDTIYTILDDSEESCWINFGPLLYHFEEEQSRSTTVSGRQGLEDIDSALSIELSLDVLIQIIKDRGFEFLKLETGIKTTYATDERSMGTWIYDSVFWVVRKKQ
ncbi:N2227-like protein-domain-containing protein [Lipomyces oligophaga]|uniref:N2227-like protein-domain-containing protein n=1 Tax=Lipomyces oligophaga TaxID=45792 RepID=UPI0034CE02D5